MSEFEEYVKRLAPLVGEFQLSETDRVAQELAYRNPFTFYQAQGVVAFARKWELDPQKVADAFVGSGKLPRPVWRPM